MNSRAYIFFGSISEKSMSTFGEDVIREIEYVLLGCSNKLTSGSNDLRRFSMLVVVVPFDVVSLTMISFAKLENALNFFPEPAAQTSFKLK